MTVAVVSHSFPLLLGFGVATLALFLATDFSLSCDWYCIGSKPRGGRAYKVRWGLLNAEQKLLLALIIPAINCIWHARGLTFYVLFAGIASESLLRCRFGDRIVKLLLGLLLLAVDLPANNE